MVLIAILLLQVACIFGPPNVIDVSGYPPEMQRRYALFAHKCSRCHSLDRPIQARIGIGGWDDYVRRMSRHPGAGISLADQREIAIFLEYHAKKELEQKR
ncbi:MAG: hypothetical protein RMK29_18120 [Myxococcales bacterium]|nr:hypothetical protein [Myxococcales bacterium]